MFGAWLSANERIRVQRQMQQMDKQGLSWVRQAPVGARSRLERLLMLLGQHSDLFHNDTTAKASESPIELGPQYFSKIQ